MSRPMTETEHVQVFRLANVHYGIVDGAAYRHRDSGGILDAHGATQHITAGGLGTKTPLQYIADIINGDPNVSCKANTVTAPDGTVYLNACGRSNHAGSCSTRGRDAFYNNAWPTSGAYTDWRGAAVNPGAFTYGDEAIAAVKMTSAQYNARVHVWAATCLVHHTDWNGRCIAGHGEFASDRTRADPNLDMGAFRSDINDMISTLKRGGSAPAPTNTAPTTTATPTPSTPTPTPMKEDEVGTPIYVRRDGMPQSVSRKANGEHTTVHIGDASATENLVSVAGACKRAQFIGHLNCSGMTESGWVRVVLVETDAAGKAQKYLHQYNSIELVRTTGSSSGMFYFDGPVPANARVRLETDLTGSIDTVQIMGSVTK